MPTIPHILLGRFPSHPFAEAAGPAGEAFLLAPLNSQAVGLDVARDHGSCTDYGAVADRDRRDQRGVRPDERSGADHCPVLAETIIIAGDGARADVGPCADFSVADVAQVVDLRALANLRLLQLNEIADLGAFSQTRSGPDPRKGAYARFRADDRAFDMAEGVDRRPIGNLDTRAED